MGKTLQIISVILRNKPSKCGPTLIVCPAAVVIQWGWEIEEKCTEAAKLSVLVYHGHNRNKDADFIRSFGVVVTTYSIMMGESSVIPKARKKKETQKGH
jgi:SNF2 family DNA or RNA helicase